jgi:D-alanyl-lipoteichoic acid acyltransferase DltB (MBOAT superfamily)
VNEDILRGLNLSKDFIIIKFIVPLGISFYTLQAISYLMDIYNNVIQPERNFGQYALYLAFFPKLISGPVERGGFLLPQIEKLKPFDYQRLIDGSTRIIWGFFKKLIIADRLGVIVNTVFDSPDNYYRYSPILILAVFSFSIQVYVDFSAYCDIAIGSAKILGIDLTENFNAPYLAKSVTEFWRRWHISFTSWLRDYIFIPLNFASRRKPSKLIKYLNIIIVFLVSGIWHGANFTFIIWGLLHGIYQAIEAVTLNLRNKIVKKYSIGRSSFSHRVFQITRTFLLVTFAWIFFRAST